MAAAFCADRATGGVAGADKDVLGCTGAIGWAARMDFPPTDGACDARPAVGAVFRTTAWAIVAGVTTLAAAGKPRGAKTRDGTAWAGAGAIAASVVVPTGVCAV